MMRRRAAAVILVALVPIIAARVVLGGGPSVAELRSLPATRADAHVDATITDADLATLSVAVERSATYVEELFAHTFRERPKLVLFGTTASFSAGLAEYFSYSEGDVARSAASYGGLYDHATATIAVNLQTIAADDRTATLDHELTHYIVRELSAGRLLPAWFEEGLATLAERHTAASRWPEADGLVGRAIAASGRVSLAELETLAAWHATYPRFGQSLYLYAENAVSQMRFRAGWPGLLGLLADVAAGKTFADAYRAASGETVADLETRIQEDRGPRIISRQPVTGDAQWTLYTGNPLAAERVTIGAKTTTYVVSFTVTTDDLGLYRGTFGSTAPPGTYIIGAAGARAEVTTAPRR